MNVEWLVGQRGRPPGPVVGGVALPAAEQYATFAGLVVAVLAVPMSSPSRSVPAAVAVMEPAL